jgi:triphosphoribosyl-dephospho-CoA synthase
VPTKILNKTINEIACAAQLAATLEVCGYPKPGNIHRLADFKDTRFEHFIAAGIAMGSAIREVAFKGIMVANGNIPINKIGLGFHIRECVKEASSWHHGRNTNLGMTILMIPLAAGAGITVAKEKAVSAQPLRKNVKLVMESSTPEDAVYFYDAIKISKPGGLGKIEGKNAPDVTSKNAKKILLEKKICLYEVMKVAAEWDDLCYEWVNGMDITFSLGYPTLAKVYDETKDINIATVHTFLKILSNRPDSLIARKIGLKYAKKISEKADRVLKSGGLLTKEGKRELLKFDRDIRTPDNRFNPGTSADLTASSLMVAILCGLKP